MTWTAERLVQVTAVHTLFYQQKGMDFFFPGERHDFWELLCLEQGRLCLLADGRGFLLQPGELFLFAPNQHHVLWSAGTQQAPSFLTLSFSIESAPGLLAGGQRFGLEQPLPALFPRLPKARLSGFEGTVFTNPGQPRPQRGIARQRMTQALEAILLHLAERQGDAAPPDARLNRQAEDGLLLQLDRFIQAHLAQPLSPDLLARALGVSASYLNRLCRRGYDLSLMGRVERLRLAWAAGQLRAGSASLTRLASLAGFASLHHFSRRFKAVYGLAPSRYRDALLPPGSCSCKSSAPQG